MENVPGNDNFNELLAIKTVTGEKYSKIKTLNEDILNVLLEQEGDNDTEIEIEEKGSDEFDLKYRTNLFQIGGFMTNDSFSETAENDSRDARRSTSATVFVKLLTINIKSFDDQPENWHTFIDSFECVIYKNDTLFDIQKMNYLKNLVEGKAATIISSIKLANENYSICLNLLKGRYEDKQLMNIHSHMSKLLKPENITDVKDVSGLRKLFDTIDIQVRSLKFGL